MQSIINSVLNEKSAQNQRRTFTNFEFNARDAEIDYKLESIYKNRRARIIVAGIGGAGNNAVSRLTDVGVDGAKTLAINTDAQDLLYSNADLKFLIGEKLTGGLGAGNRPEVGEAAALENVQELKELMRADMVFITCGLGGGTGTGASHVVAQQARENSALVITICTLPFNVEGARKRSNALWGLEKLSKVSDCLITVPNEKLLEIAPDLSLVDAFRVADEVLVRGVKGISELVTNVGIINVDFADVRTTLKDSGEALIGIGEGTSVEEATRNAIFNPLLDINIENARAALINICCSNQMSLQDTESVISMITEELNGNVEIIWGVQVVPELNDKIRVTALISGVQAENPLLEDPSVKKSSRIPDLGLPRLG
ncbi:MAG: cell division protein FtsZ [Candidatus Helarchaeales archaeon]